MWSRFTGSSKFSGRLAKAVLVAVVALAFLVPVYGSELEDLQRQQEQVNRRIKEYQGQIRRFDAQARSISEELRVLEEEIRASEAEIDRLGSEMARVQGELKVVEQELGQAEAELNQRTQAFHRRLKIMYQEGTVNYLEVLLDATSITDFLVRFGLVEKIAEQDMAMLEELKIRRAQVEGLRNTLKTKADNLAALKKSVEDEKTRLDAQREEQERALNAIRTQRDLLAKALAEEEEASRQLAQRIRELQRVSRGGPYTGGRFGWPVPASARVTSDYGMRLHPLLNERRMHTGVDIGAPEGSSVVAVADGTVIFAGWFGAYGNTIVIDHGGGVASMYAHLSSISVSEGQKVDRGDNIGRVGDTGWSTGPHLHFEVRVNGDPVNPWGYLR